MMRRTNPDAPEYRSLAPKAASTCLLPMYAHLCLSCRDYDWTEVWTDDGSSCDICRAGIVALAKLQLCSFCICRRHRKDAQKLMTLAHAVVMLDGFAGV